MGGLVAYESALTPLKRRVSELILIKSKSILKPTGSLRILPSIWRSGSQRKIAEHRLYCRSRWATKQPSVFKSVNTHGASFWKKSGRSGAIKPTLYLTTWKSRRFRALLGDEHKIVILVHLQKVLGLSWIFLWDLVTSKTLICRPSQARSSLYSEQRWAGSWSLFAFGKITTFCVNFSTDQNWCQRPGEASNRFRFCSAFH